MKKTPKAKPVSVNRSIALRADALVSVRGGVRDSNAPIDQGLKEAGSKPDM